MKTHILAVFIAQLVMISSASARSPGFTCINTLDPTDKAHVTISKNLFGRGKHITMTYEFKVKEEYDGKPAIQVDPVFPQAHEAVNDYGAQKIELEPASGQYRQYVTHSSRFAAEYTSAESKILVEEALQNGKPGFIYYSSVWAKSNERAATFVCVPW